MQTAKWCASLSCILLAGCATQPTNPPPAPVPIPQPAPLAKRIDVPPSPLDSLSPAVRDAFLSGQTAPFQDRMTWEMAYDRHAVQTIECAPMHVTEIVFSSNESVVKVEPGDTDRWDVSVDRNRLLVKPVPPGRAAAGTTTLTPAPESYSTNLVAATDRNTYHFMLVSRPGRWMEQVEIYYPDQIRAALDARAAALQANGLPPDKQQEVIASDGPKQHKPSVQVRSDRRGRAHSGRNILRDADLVDARANACNASSKRDGSTDLAPRC